MVHRGQAGAVGVKLPIMLLLVFWCLDIQDIQSAFLTPQFSCIGKHIGSGA